MTRAERNNNPGNLKHTANGRLLSAYTGEIRPTVDSTFRAFKSNLWGYRALLHQLNAYLKRGLNTIEEIIPTYAPSTENNTRAYVSDVSKWTGWSVNKKIQPSDLVTLAAAISRKESGKIPDMTIIVQAAKLLKSGTGNKIDEKDQLLINSISLIAAFSGAYFIERKL